jgi:hypothetical protein
MREKGNAYRVLVEKPERKRPIGRTMHRWKDNIKMEDHSNHCAKPYLILKTSNGLMNIRCCTADRIFLH